VLASLLREGAAQIAEATERIARAAPRFVVFAARGTSDHAALYAKYLTEIKLGLPAGLASLSSMTVYQARPDLSDVLFVAVSQSGGSPDLIESLTAARECGALTMAVTNDPSSPLAVTSDIEVDVRAGREAAVAATKTYTAELLALFLLFGGPGAAGRAAGLAEAAARTLASDAAARVAGRYRTVSQLVTTARGYSYPTAREAALKLMETSYLSAQAFSAADLLHGPMAMVDADVPVIAVTAPGRGGTAMTPVVERLVANGVDVLCVGVPDGLPIVADGIDEELLPILEILPLQQLAWRVALDRGHDPDRPRGLTKVTKTW
jgi:glutamine---fructose-6-phosphate transaminase (isomerizing)